MYHLTSNIRALCYNNAESKHIAIVDASKLNLLSKNYF